MGRGRTSNWSSVSEPIYKVLYMEFVAYCIRTVKKNNPNSFCSNLGVFYRIDFLSS